MKPRLLYIIHTAWGWIKQRPQFLAEGLSEHFEIDVLYRKSNHIGDGLNTTDYGSEKRFNVSGFRHLPFERLTFLPLESTYSINRLLWKTKKIDLKSYDFVWVTDALLWWNIREEIIKLKVGSNANRTPRLIYDCMDDALEFPYFKRYPKLIEFMKACEKDLIEKADYVFSSSAHLGKCLQERYGTQKHIYTVNNAISDDLVSAAQKICDDRSQSSDNKYDLTYIGTVSEWLDFRLILAALNRFSRLRVKIYGPLRAVKLPEHPRLMYMGTVPHKDVPKIMAEASGLIMPFVVNELIRSVNPVKLYEYIASGKPVAAPRYGETEAFEDYVTLYSDDNEFFEFIERFVMGNEKTDRKEMSRFAQSNTWTARCSQIVDILTGNNSDKNVR